MWRFADTGFNNGKFNMDYDLNLVQNFSGTPVFRVYRWEPFCISLGANQDFNSINYQKASADSIDIVKRPTGGRAILHAKELTYSVVFPITEEYSPKKIYREINLALKNGLVNYNSTLDKIDLENTQPHFPSFYKNEKSNLCFAVSAMNELNFDGKKIVGSAQRKMGDVILQHGSILCGSFHKNIISYLNLSPDKIDEIKNEIEHTTTELETILNEKINYESIAHSIKKGFEDHFNIEFEEEMFLETNPQVN